MSGRKRSGASRSFTIFAIGMVGFLVLGTVAVLGVSLFGSDDTSDDGVSDTVQEETSRLETAVASNPEDGDAAAILANIYVSQGNIAGAIPLFERATAARPDDGNLRLSFGIALLRNQSILDARVQLEKALVLLPESAAPSYYLGQLEQSKENPDDEAARAWYEQAIEIAPESRLAEQARERINELDGIVATPTPGN